MERISRRTHAFIFLSMGVTLISRVILNLREVSETLRVSWSIIIVDKLLWNPVLFQKSIEFETVSLPKWNADSNHQTGYTSKLGSLVRVAGGKTAGPGWDLHMKVIDISRTQQYPDLVLQKPSDTFWYTLYFSLYFGTLMYCATDYACALVAGAFLDQDVFVFHHPVQIILQYFPSPVKIILHPRSRGRA